MNSETIYLTWEASRALPDLINRILPHCDLHLDISSTGIGDKQFYHNLYEAVCKHHNTLSLTVNDYSAQFTSSVIKTLHYANSNAIHINNHDRWLYDNAEVYTSTQETKFNVIANDGLYEHHKSLCIMLLQQQGILAHSNVLFSPGKKVDKFLQWRSFQARSAFLYDYCVQHWAQWLTIDRDNVRHNSELDVCILDNWTYKTRPALHVNRCVYDSMLCRKPFVVIGAPGILSQLRNLGFETFNKYLDESYDTIEDNNLRTQAVVDQLTQLNLPMLMPEIEHNYILLRKYRETAA